MRKIYSKIDSSKVLHIIHRSQDFVTERKDVIPPENWMQLATLSLEKGKTFRPHRHLWKKPSFTEMIAQESWVVISGKVRAFLYDIDNTMLEHVDLLPGDCSITLEGGHTYEILEDGTKVYEYKTGPYTGQKNDKKFIDDDGER